MKKPFLSLLMACAVLTVYADKPKSVPKKIVVLEFGLLDEINLLGIKPIGVATSGAIYEGADPEYLSSVISSTTHVGARDAPNFEAIARLKPDLIIGDVDFNSSGKSQLEKIAPTLLLPGIFGMPDQQVKNINQLAQLTQTTNRLPEILKTYNIKATEAVKVANAGGKTKILIGFATPDGTFKALANNSITSKILANLCKNNLVEQSTASQLYEMSTEGVLAKNPDQIVIMTTKNDRNSYNSLSKNPLWQQLAAVKNNKVYFVDRNIWGKSHGIQALELMYDQAINSGFLSDLKAKN